MLVPSNFSCSHDVFKKLVLETHENQGLPGKGLKDFTPCLFSEKLEFGDLDMKPELKLLYQHLAVFVDKSNGEIFEITGKITQTLE